jgi:hypothetical protein
MILDDDDAHAREHAAELPPRKRRATKRRPGRPDGAAQVHRNATRQRAIARARLSAPFGSDQSAREAS